MRIAALSSFALLTLAGCKGGETCGDGTIPVDGECPCEETGYPSDFDGGVCPNPCAPNFERQSDGICRTSCTDGTSVEDISECMVVLDPVAVGFEYEGGFLNGEWTEWTLDDGTGTTQSIPPAIYVTFANAEYFDASTADEQIGHNCTVFALVDTVASSGTSIPTANGGVWNSWDLALTLENASSWSNTANTENCAGLIDSEVWGTAGMDLFNTFDGMHLGIGFGPMTTYLEAGWAAQDFLDYGDTMFAMYIGMNDANGTFTGKDWTTGLLWQWEESTKTPLAVDNAYVPSDLSNVTALPSGFVRSSAYWYEDFPNLDLSNLADGAPTSAR